MNLSRALGHVRDNARAFGAAAALHDLHYRALNQVVPFEILRGAVLSDLNPDLFEAKGFDIRFPERDELLAAATPEYEMTREFVQRALAKGDECFAIYDGDRLASFGWFSNQPTHISESLVLHFDPAWIYMYKAFTHPDYRGKRLSGLGMSAALRVYTQRGGRGLISYVKSNNFPSLRTMKRIGYRIFGDIYLACAFGRVFTWATPGCSRYQFRLEWIPTPVSVEDRS